MGNCLNSLEDPIILISLAALLAIVLLFWAQIHSRSDTKHPNVNFYLGLSWTYLALLSAFAAVAFLVACENRVLAKDFIVLAFLVTAANLINLFIQSIARPILNSMGRPPDESIFRAGRDVKAYCNWGTLWLLGLVVLIVLSFWNVWEPFLWWVSAIIPLPKAFYWGFKIIERFRKKEDKLSKLKHFCSLVRKFIIVKLLRQK